VECGVCKTGHAIVCGFGHLGRRVAEQLRQRGCEVIAIDLKVDDAMRRLAERIGCDLLEGDMCDDEVLEQAGVRTASCLMATTDNDRANLEAGIDTRQANPNAAVVVRLFDQALAKRVESTFNIHALSASFLASPAYVSAATDDSMVAMFNIDGCYLSVFRDLDGCDPKQAHSGVWVRKSGSSMRVVECSEQDDGNQERLFVATQKTPRGPTSRARRRATPKARPLVAPNLLREIAAAWRHTTGITRQLLVALLSVGLLSVFMFSWFGKMSPLNSLYFVVTTMTTVGYGDFNLQNAPAGLKIFGVLMMLSGAGLLATVYAIIADRVLSARVEYLLGRKAVNLRGHTVVVGLGNVGFRVAHDLQMLGVEVVAVEVREDSDNVSTARSMFPVVIGDASRASVLQKAGIDHASAVLAVTDDPMLNLSVALHARERNSEIKTILRTYEFDFARRFEGLGLDAVLSTSAIASPAFVDTALYPDVEGSFRLGEDDILVANHLVEPDSPLLARTVEEIGDQMGIAVAMAADGESWFKPLKPDQTLVEGQRVIALLLRENVGKLRRMG